MQSISATGSAQLVTLFRMFYRTHRYFEQRHICHVCDVCDVCVAVHTQDDSIDCQLNNYGSDNVSFVCRIIILKLSKLRLRSFFFFVVSFRFHITLCVCVCDNLCGNNECQFEAHATRVSFNSGSQAETQSEVNRQILSHKIPCILRSSKMKTLGVRAFDIFNELPHFFQLS